jgi:hypothetical protein
MKTQPQEKTKGNAPDFVCFGVIDNEKEEGKAYWTRLGVAFKTKVGYNIILSALPVNAKIVLMPPKEDE